jgi:hypothetical protein
MTAILRLGAKHIVGPMMGKIDFQTVLVYTLRLF